MAIPCTGSADAFLVRLAQEGETRAFDELTRRYQERVYRLSYWLLQHERDADETLTEVFVSAYRGLEGFQEASFSTWLYRITTIASLVKWRHRQDDQGSRDPSPNRSGVQAMPLRPGSTQRSEALLAAGTREAMEAGIQRLHWELRTVFVLHDIGGLTNAEVAAILRLSVPAVRARLHRGRIFLRDWMTRHVEDPATHRLHHLERAAGDPREFSEPATPRGA